MAAHNRLNDRSSSPELTAATPGSVEETKIKKKTSPHKTDTSKSLVKISLLKSYRKLKNFG